MKTQTPPMPTSSHQSDTTPEPDAISPASGSSHAHAGSDTVSTASGPEPGVQTDRPATPAADIWDEDRLANPHAASDKATRVHAMFDAIAGSYDLNNRVHSLGQDQAWRRKAVRLAQVRPGEDDVVDVACGTGDLTLAFARAQPRSVLGIDFVPRMIEIARDKVAEKTPAGTDSAERPSSSRRMTSPTYRVGDAMDLDLPDQCADVVSIAFGIRNVADPDKAIGEFHRILRPGGRLLILEFSLPRNPVLRRLYEFYFNHIMPRTATIVSGDRTGAYRYLPRSVSTFLDRDALTGAMKQAGFEDVAVHPLT
ncbi:MAG: class I SAM-dependent methyltransferase, partial [Planctomycetota bacterium]